MGHQVFVSHSSKDKLVTDAVVAHLERNGIRCWVAPRDILPGASWAKSILSAVAASKLMVLIFSDHTNASHHIRREVERAVFHGIPLAPLRINDVLPTDELEYFLSGSHWMDAMTPPIEQHLRVFAERLAMLLAASVDAPSVLPPPVLFPTAMSEPAGPDNVGPTDSGSGSSATRPTEITPADTSPPGTAPEAPAQTIPVSPILILQTPAQSAPAPPAPPSSTPTRRPGSLSRPKPVKGKPRGVLAQLVGGVVLMVIVAVGILYACGNFGGTSQLSPNVAPRREVAPALGGAGDATGAHSGEGSALSHFDVPSGNGGSQTSSPFMGIGSDGRRIVYLVDASGSMLTVFPRVKQELMMSVSNLQATQAFNIIVFHEDVSELATLTKGELRVASADNKAAAGKFMDDQRAMGGTDPIPAIKLAFSQKPDLIYVLTDGFDDVDSFQPVIDLFRTLNTGHAKINAIMLKSHDDPALEHVLKTITDDGGGIFRIINAVEPTVLRTMPTISVRPVGETWTNSIGMKFARIPAGRFRMGSSTNEAGRDDDEIWHEVVFTNGFLLATTDVTQAQWRAVMATDPSHFKGDDLPVERVSWNETLAFCQKLGTKEGRRYGLPTEAGWEYACRAGTTTAYNTGDSEADLALAGWYEGNSDQRTHAVGTKLSNAWGLFDMHGNVFQWCADYAGAAMNEGAINPRGPTVGTDHVVRGGSWGDNPAHCRCAYRDSRRPDLQASNIGFRLALELP